MYYLNRDLVIIKPQKPYIDWANSVFDDTCIHRNFEEDCRAVLIKVGDTRQVAEKFIRKHFRQIFEDELWAWCTDEGKWPRKLTYRMFQKWFKLEYHSEVIDFIPHHPLLREEM